MKFQIGDIVTRKSHNNDIVFIITDIADEVCYLKGVNIRLLADSNMDDLVKHEKVDTEEQYIEPEEYELNRDEYFYIPGKILHIDSDNDYLDRCLKYYEKVNIWAKGVKMREEDLKDNIKSLLEQYKPNIVVMTGHDAFCRKNDKKYKNSDFFCEAIKEARNYENSHDKLIIIAGACQSNYEKLIQAGANFASSPKRINIHALDPAIIAVKMSTSEVGVDINLKKILDSTKYGHDGIGGIKTKGTMYVGYPR